MAVTRHEDRNWRAENFNLTSYGKAVYICEVLVVFAISKGSILRYSIARAMRLVSNERTFGKVPLGRMRGTRNALAHFPAYIGCATPPASLHMLSQLLQPRYCLPFVIRIRSPGWSI